MEELTIALLIDTDNIGAKHIDNILNELAKYGRVTIRRMYGDWTQERLKPWVDKSSQFSLTPIMQSNDSKTNCVHNLLTLPGGNSIKWMAKEDILWLLRL